MSSTNPLFQLPRSLQIAIQAQEMNRAEEVKASFARSTAEFEVHNFEFKHRHDTRAEREGHEADFDLLKMRRDHAVAHHEAMKDYEKMWGEHVEAQAAGLHVDRQVLERERDLARVRAMCQTRRDEVTEGVYQSADDYDRVVLQQRPMLLDLVEVYGYDTASLMLSAYIPEHLDQELENQMRLHRVDGTIGAKQERHDEHTKKVKQQQQLYLETLKEQSTSFYPKPTMSTTITPPPNDLEQSFPPQSASERQRQRDKQTDWKAKYDQLKIAYDFLQSEYDDLMEENNGLQAHLNRAISNGDVDYEERPTSNLWQAERFRHL